jgi:hypothetical protein
MGIVNHNAIIVTGVHEEGAKASHKIACELFGEDVLIGPPSSGVFGRNLVSPIIESTSNSYFSFFIAPDGSKEGWPTSNSYDNRREEFMRRVDDRSAYVVEVQFGELGDKIVNSGDLES